MTGQVSQTYHSVSALVSLSITAAPVKMLRLMFLLGSVLQNSIRLVTPMRTILLVAIALSMSGCDTENPSSSTTNPVADTGPSTEQESTVDDNTPRSDEELILGTWTSVRFEKDGVEDPLGAGGKAVFGKEDAFVHGLPFFSYELDSRQSPKQFSTSTMKAIYQLEGETLTFCMATSSTAPRPTDFTTAPGDRRNLMVFQRAYPLAENATDAEFDGDLQRTIKEGIRRIENEDWRGVGQWLGQPLPDELLANGLDEGVRQRMQQLLATLKVMLKVTPKLSTAKDKATFDVSGIHIEGGIAHQWWFNFVRKDGSWYPTEDRNPLVE